MKPWKLLLSGILLLGLGSCASVKPYERQFVDDAAMKLKSDACGLYKGYVFSIREGSTPASGAKGSGGCGCN
jgi:hypothetical protein